MTSIAVTSHSRSSAAKHFWSAVIVVSAVIVLHSRPAIAEGAGAFQAGISASTLGFGGEVGYRGEHFGFRAGLNSLDAQREETVDDLDLTVDLKMSSVSGVVDWHPAGGGFRLTAGVLSGSNSIAVSSAASELVAFGEGEYTAAEIGTVQGTVSLGEGAAPYAGFGWAIPFGKHVTVDFDFGAVFNGTPTVSLTADGLLAGDSSFQADLETARADLEAELSGLAMYPVGRIGISIRF